VDVDQAEMADRARRGDVAAFEVLVSARLERILRLVTAIVLDEAEAADVAQETFVAAWRQLPRLREPAGFDGWLTRIAVNEARMALRARRRRRVREIAVDRSDLALAALPPGAGVDARRLAAALDRLNADQRSLLALHYLEGHDVAGLAATLAIPAGTVKSRLFTARRALRAALEAEAAE
jgi:RNA polymerase sigma-70 factor, ECF subfamily